VGSPAYFVYVIQCADTTFYTGITTDLERRIDEHNHSPKGAKYTRARRPVVLCYSEEYPNKSKALKREMAIKKMTRNAKKDLIKKEKS